MTRTEYVAENPGPAIQPNRCKGTSKYATKYERVKPKEPDGSPQCGAVHRWLGGLAQAPMKRAILIVSRGAVISYYVKDLQLKMGSWQSKKKENLGFGVFDKWYFQCSYSVHGYGI